MRASVVCDASTVQTKSTVICRAARTILAAISADHPAIPATIPPGEKFVACAASYSAHAHRPPKISGLLKNISRKYFAAETSDARAKSSVGVAPIVIAERSGPRARPKQLPQ